MAQVQELQQYQPKDFSRLIGTDGFSDRLLENHFQLYEGYVENTNKALSRMRSAELDEYAANEVRRRFVWEFNGMRLHEIYFGGMKNGGADFHDAPDVKAGVEKEFGSIEKWQRSFEDVGGMRGIGWACLTYDPLVDRFFNTWINEHDAGPLVQTDPIILMDVFEHAFIIDYDLDKQSYMSAFMDAVDWSVAEKRLQEARNQSS